MGGALVTLVTVIVLVIAACFIGSLILAKNTKEFHIHFGLLNGFYISGSFYENGNTQENHQ